MANVMLPRNKQGRLVLPGKTEHETVWDFADLTTLPAAITLAAGTAPVTTRAASRGEVKLTTGTAIGNTASLNLPQIDTSFCETVSLTVEGVKSAPADCPEIFSIGMTGATNVGAFAKKEATATDLYIKYANAQAP